MKEHQSGRNQQCVVVVNAMLPRRHCLKAQKRQRNVFESEEHVKAVTGHSPDFGGLGRCDNGDESRLELRSRLVVQETKRVTTLGPQDAASAFAGGHFR